MVVFVVFYGVDDFVSEFFEFFSFFVNFGFVVFWLFE